MTLNKPSGWEGWIDTVQNMDCLEGMKQMPEGCVDFVLTDPPFNVGLDYEQENDSDNIPDQEYSEYLQERISEFHRCLKKSRYALMFSGDKKMYWVMVAIYRTAFIFHHFMKWHKPTCQRALPGSVLFNRTELAPLMSKGKPDIHTINRKILFQDTLIYPNNHPGLFEYGHPTARPVKLYSHLIQGFTNPGDLILDPFMGSGTTAVACKQLGRRFIGFEINPTYVRVCNERLKQTELFSGVQPCNQRLAQGVFNLKE